MAISYQQRFVVMMQLSRKHVIDVMRRTGYAHLVDEAMQVLPDPVDLEQVEKWGGKYGITREKLVNDMGGSP